ncbi:type II toxin-antitoxin system RelE/ParE family toxin [candidate division KSB1 bacterium]|nr:type II toxin-antitoxin system RelE/ParE family toxin [candidate division KSB1 bacterium]
MAKIRWTSKAVKQLEQIVDFISEDSNHYATLTVRNIFKKVRLLKSHPRRFLFSCSR